MRWMIVHTRTVKHVGHVVGVLPEPSCGRGYKQTKQKMSEPPAIPV